MQNINLITFRFINHKKVSHLKFRLLAVFTIYPQMSCLGLNFVMSNIYFPHFLLHNKKSLKREKSRIKKKENKRKKK